MSNRIEKVDEAVDDAITLTLGKRSGIPYGQVRAPAAASPALTSDQVSEELPPRTAFRSAVQLANALKLAIVVVDPEGLWDTEWGELYRPEDGPEDGPDDEPPPVTAA
jgi:hypothetical protein